LKIPAAPLGRGDAVGEPARAAVGECQVGDQERMVAPPVADRVEESGRIDSGVADIDHGLRHPVAAADDDDSVGADQMRQCLDSGDEAACLVALGEDGREVERRPRVTCLQLALRLHDIGRVADGRRGFKTAKPRLGPLSTPGSKNAL